MSPFLVRLRYDTFATNVVDVVNTMNLPYFSLDTATITDIYDVKLLHRYCTGLAHSFRSASRAVSSSSFISTGLRLNVNLIFIGEPPGG